MQKFHLSILFSLSVLNLFSQTAVQKEYFGNTIKKYDTIIKGDTIKYETVYDRNNSSYCGSEGKYILHNNSWYPIGIHKYYSNGEIIKETLYSYLHEVKYINYWSGSRIQYLKDGNGEISEIEYQGEGITDSLVYEIHDSVKHGLMERWRKNNDQPIYKLFMTSVFDKNVEQGVQTKYYRSGKIQEISQIVDGKTNGYHQKFYESGTLKECGDLINYMKDGTWKYWTIRGILFKECNYINNKLHGDYLEYDTVNKKCIVVRGKYSFTNGIDTVVYFDPSTGQDIIEIKKHKEAPAKDGLWEYYDNTGKLIMSKKYELGKLLPDAIKY